MGSDIEGCHRSRHATFEAAAKQVVCDTSRVAGAGGLVSVGRLGGWCCRAIGPCHRRVIEATHPARVMYRRAVGGAGATRPRLIGHASAGRSWLLWCPERDLCLAETVDQTTAAAVPCGRMPRKSNDCAEVIGSGAPARIGGVCGGSRRWAARWGVAVLLPPAVQLPRTVGARAATSV